MICSFIDFNVIKIKYEMNITLLLSNKSVLSFEISKIPEMKSISEIIIINLFSVLPRKLYRLKLPNRKRIESAMTER